MQSSINPNLFKSLETLRLQAKKNCFSLEDIQWSHPVNRDQSWTPDVMLPWSYLPVYKKLSGQHRLRYNQLFALATAELFVWFESDLVCQVLNRVLATNKLGSQLRENLEIFIEEEEKHSEMFWMLMQKSEPEIYAQRDYVFFKRRLGRTIFEKALTQFPNLSLAWVWVAIMMEERTLSYSTHYYKEREKIDSLFVEVHHLHLKDEVRHVQLDVHLLKEIYNKAPVWRRNLAAKMLYSFIKSYLVPYRVSGEIIKRMQSEFGDFGADTGTEIMHQLPMLRDSVAFQKVRFGRENMPRFRELISAYPEMRKIHSLLGSVAGDRND